MTRFERIAEAAGVRLCSEPGCERQGTGDHGTVHLGRQRYTPQGALLLLKLAYQARFGFPPRRAAWHQRYERVKWILQVAGDAGVRIPRSAWETERALMREDISRYKRRYSASARVGEDISALMAAEAWAKR